MKKYKKVELIAKNQIAGSYAAGCPSKDRGGNCVLFNHNPLAPGANGCVNCERTK